MKKLLATILAFVYLSTSMGATVHLHYCMGKLVSWGLHEHQSSNCIICGMAKKATSPGCEISSNNCCKNEHHQIKTDKDQKVTQSEWQVPKSSPFATSVVYSPLLAFQAISFIIEHPTANAPPLNSGEPVFLLNCNFRI